jgi:8-oxo-dGTP pyrophosphatase MutT (NUDIX family)
VSLDHDPTPPMRTLSSGVAAGRSGRFTLRDDLCEWQGGARSPQTVVEGPCAALVVPVFAGGATVLVRQWRHAWRSTSWEVPAGTLEAGENPEPAAARELEEEAGLRAMAWTGLGQIRPQAASTVVQHLFLARELTRVERRPETSERDMIVRELPLEMALEATMTGEIEHAGSCVALVRAARALRLV